MHAFRYIRKQYYMLKTNANTVKIDVNGHIYLCSTVVHQFKSSASDI